MSAANIRCIYCGARTRSSGRTCRYHADLPRRDPYFAASTRKAKK